MDVLLVDGNPSEFDKLKQVRRQNVKPISLQLGSHTMTVQQKLGQGAFASVYQVIAWATILQCFSLVLNITMQVPCQKHRCAMPAALQNLGVAGKVAAIMSGRRTST